VSTEPKLTLTTVTLNTPDPIGLAHFYGRLLGWEPDDEGHPEWVILADPTGGVGMAFQLEPRYVAPVWPTKRSKQQVMMHLEIRVDELASALAHAVECGATVADHQPQDDVRVCLDPSGHPFCLWLAG
jgi:catechol 2,3-dioxygenase-like lactoylglutathione lyase family enzyme